MLRRGFAWNILSGDKDIRAEIRGSKTSETPMEFTKCYQPYFLGFS